MRTIIILGVVLFIAIGCGDEIRNSPPVVLLLIIYGRF